MRMQLVNLQSNSEFASHQLNRDTWRDETLVSIIQGSFVFLQVRSRTISTATNSCAATVVCICMIACDCIDIALPHADGTWLLGVLYTLSYSLPCVTARLPQ